ncbi:hypothetical protein ACFQNE_14150 [Gordonia phosphorivorans]|uniref:Uncharacterized protein n=1 Tax=Gordonia phosphorivorans TaxID=1056982 RepID=A0ABV6H7K7_9ACTN
MALTSYPNDAVTVVVDNCTTVEARLIGFDDQHATVELAGHTTPTIVASTDVLCAQCGNWETILTCGYKLHSRYNRGHAQAS